MLIGFISDIHDPSQTWQKDQYTKNMTEEFDTFNDIFIKPFLLVTSTCLFLKKSGDFRRNNTSIVA